MTSENWNSIFVDERTKAGARKFNISIPQSPHVRVEIIKPFHCHLISNILNFLAQLLGNCCQSFQCSTCRLRCFTKILLIDAYCIDPDNALLVWLSYPLDDLSRARWNVKRSAVDFDAH
ncbi:hypothetical protein BST61_g3757 [Cercospora zeina]